MVEASGSIQQLLVSRARLLESIRKFLTRRGALEVETPLRYPSTSSAPCLDSFPADAGFFLQTSPEFPMKRLLAQGSGPIFQICKAFRAGEAGARHNPEFTMLEWYRPGFDCEQLMHEIHDLVGTALGCPVEVFYTTYRDCFFAATGLDCAHVSDAELRMLAASALNFDADLDRAGLLDLLFSGLVEPTLDPVVLNFVTDYPEELAELSEIEQRPEKLCIAKRFEAFLGGMELANGCVELADPARLQMLWKQNNQRRLATGKQEIPEDRALIDGLAGTPPVAGAALGVDRLLMHLLHASRIDAVLAFPDSSLRASAQLHLNRA